MDWFAISWEQAAGLVVSAVFVYIFLILFVRLNGLRSFSKMSSHDFAVTIATGSILANTVLQKEPSILQGSLAIAVLLGLQSLFSKWRLRKPQSYIERYFENEPLLLMKNGEILHRNLEKAKITEKDLIAKLRENGVLNPKEVKAVVFETTGDISVMHGNGELDDYLLKDVRRE